MCPPSGHVLGPKTGPKMSPRGAHNGVPFWSPFWCNFGSLLGVFRGPSGPEDWPGRGLEEPKRAKWSSERPKRRLSKKWFSHRTVCIFSFLRPPRRPQEAQKTAKERPEGAQKPKKRAPNENLKKKRFWDHFWVGKWSGKGSGNGRETYVFMHPFWGAFWDSYLVHFGDPVRTPFLCSLPCESVF